MLQHPTVLNNQLTEELEEAPVPRLAVLGRERNRAGQLCAVARSRDLDAHEAALPLADGELEHCDLILIDAGTLSGKDRLWLRGILSSLKGKPIVAICEGVRLGDAVDLVDAGIEDVLDWSTLTSAHLARAVHLSIARHRKASPASAIPNPPRAASTPGPRTDTVTLLQECASAMVMVDAEGMVRFANPEAEHMLGVPVGSLTGAPFALELSGESKEEILLDGPNGRQVQAEVRVVETELGDVPVRVVSLQDMSLRHVLEKHFSS